MTAWLVQGVSLCGGRNVLELDTMVMVAQHRQCSTQVPLGGLLPSLYKVSSRGKGKFLTRRVNGQGEQDPASAISFQVQACGGGGEVGGAWEESSDLRGSVRTEHVPRPMRGRSWLLGYEVEVWYQLS